MAKGNVAALFAAQFFKVYNGRSYGQIADPANPGTNVTSHAYLVDHPVEVAMPEIQFERATFRGGGQWLGSLTIGVTEMPDIPMQFAAQDDTLAALAGGASVDTTTVSGWEISGMNELNPDPNQLGVILTTKWQSRDSGTDGNNMYANYILLSGQLRLSQPPLSHGGGENPVPLRGNYTISPASSFPNGVPFGANQNFYRNRAVVIRIVSPRPIALTTYIADGEATTFTLGFLPWKSTVTGGNTDNFVAKAGTATAPSSISTSTGVVTLSAAGTSADYWAALYQVKDSSFPVPA